MDQAILLEIVRSSGERAHKALRDHVPPDQIGAVLWQALRAGALSNALSAENWAAMSGSTRTDEDVLLLLKLVASNPHFAQRGRTDPAGWRSGLAALLRQVVDRSSLMAWAETLEEPLLGGLRFGFASIGWSSLPEAEVTRVVDDAIGSGEPRWQVLHDLADKPGGPTWALIEERLRRAGWWRGVDWGTRGAPQRFVPSEAQALPGWSWREIDWGTRGAPQRFVPSEAQALPVPGPTAEELEEIAALSSSLLTAPPADEAGLPADLGHSARVGTTFRSFGAAPRVDDEFSEYPEGDEPELLVPTRADTSVADRNEDLLVPQFRGGLTAVWSVVHELDVRVTLVASGWLAFLRQVAALPPESAIADLTRDAPAARPIRAVDVDPRGDSGLAEWLGTFPPGALVFDLRAVTPPVRVPTLAARCGLVMWAGVPPPDLDLAWVRTVVELGDLDAAARQLQVHPIALVRRLTALERSLRSPITTRGRPRFVLAGDPPRLADDLRGELELALALLEERNAYWSGT